MKPSIKERLDKIHFIEVKADLSSLSDSERQALAYCAKASELMTDIYLDQAYADNKRLIQELSAKNDDNSRDSLRYLMVQGEPWDTYNHNEPFISGVGAKPPFGSFYPTDLTKQEWNDWLAKHPDDRQAFKSNYTVIKRDDDRLVAVPYSVEYSNRLVRAAEYLEKAAGYLDEGPLRTFLTERAKAFRTNDFFDSEMAWVDTTGEPFEITIGPYEVYFDELLGLKAAFEAYVGIPDKTATAALEKFKSQVAGFNELLQHEFDFKPKGLKTPMVIANDVVRGGGATFGYVFVAFNLPNDRRVHDLKGSKKVFSKTLMNAKFDQLIMPAARKILSDSDLKNCTGENNLLFIIGHEIAHGCGPSTVDFGDKQVSFDVTLGDLYSTIEEAKADMLGVRFLDYLRSQGLVTNDEMAGVVTTRLAADMSFWRHGYTEAHSRGSLIEYNWLRSNGAVSFNTSSGKFDIDIEKCIRSMSDLSTELLNVEISGDYDTAKAFMDKWSTVQPEIPEIVAKLTDIDVAVSPVWDLSHIE